ncbi:MAG: recombination protein RecR [Candidatus Hydrogenedentota bacterium]|nr:MAG: recombination protein RecR [Candidatus Hydrogenedentota bacterium]
MEIRPQSFLRLVRAISRLPTLGTKSATRVALWLLSQPPDIPREIAQALIEIPPSLTRCRFCHILSDEEECPVCRDPSRNSSLICVVAESTDAWRIEETGSFAGLYHILGGLISPLDGIGPSQLHIDSLVSRISNSSPSVEEVLLALPGSTEGQATAGYLRDTLSHFPNLRFTRPAFGIPVGGDLSFSDPASLQEALLSRRPMDIPSPSNKVRAT